MNPHRIIEVEEYCFATTSAGLANDIKGSFMEVKADLRQMLWLHRMMVYGELLRLGVPLPLDIVSDQANPPPGQQSVDKPSEGA